MARGKMRTRLRGIAAVVTAVALSTALFGCGNSGGNTAASTDFAGTWEVRSWTDSDGNKHGAAACGAMRDLGLNIVMELGEDGSVDYSQWGMESEGAWEASGSGGVLESDGEVLDGGKLSLDGDMLTARWDDGTEMTFSRNADAAATASDYSGALVGTWEVVYAKSSTEEYDQDDWEAVRANGQNVVLTLSEDLSGTLDTTDATGSGSWSQSSPVSGTLTVNGIEDDIVINADATLILTAPDGAYFAFRKTSGETTAPDSASDGGSVDTGGAVNTDNFNAIQSGMSYEGVAALMGSEGELVSESDAAGSSSQTYQWEADGWGVAQVTFMDGKVVNKTQIGVGGDSAAAVTAAQYDQVAEGMSYDEVVSIMGGEGQLVSDTGVAGVSMQIYTWDGSTFGSNCTITFYDGAVYSKSQVGLE